MIIIHTFTSYFLIVPGLILLFIAAIFITFSITKAVCNANNNIAIAIALFIIGLVMFFTGIVMCVQSETYHQILINENTLITEVQQKYEIVGQKGISYIVKDIDT